MFGRKKESDGSDKKRKGQDLMAQMGLDFGGPPPPDGMYDNEDDDDDLEAELARLAGDSSPPVAPRTKPKRRPGDSKQLSNINKMAQDGLRDINMDDISDADDDPDLLAELTELTSDDREEPIKSLKQHQQQQALPSNYIRPAERPPSLNTAPQNLPKPSAASGPVDILSVLNERHALYTSALANAKAANETTKARRYTRGIKTLNDLLKQAKAGKPVPESEIPQMVAVGGSSAQSTPLPTPTTPSSASTVKSEPTAAAISPTQMTTEPPSVSSSDISLLHERQMEYKKAALVSKNSGDLEKAREMFKISKQFDAVIQAAKVGKAVDLSKMPPSLSHNSSPKPHVEEESPAASAAIAAAKAMTEDEVKKMFNTPDKPQSTMEALQQRLEKYQSAVDSAKAEASGSKARRMSRIVKQYQDAIKDFKAGRAVNFEELPTPPGFVPIPTGCQGATAAADESKSPARSVAKAPVAPPAESCSPVASTSPRQAVSPKNKLPSKQLQQLAFLRERQKQFKMAALTAKKRGDNDTARDYLRSAKGFDGMIEAVTNGLKVDMTNVPRPPGMDVDSIEGFEFIEKSDVAGYDEGDPAQGNRETMFKRLEQELIEQIKKCGNNSEHYTQIGDVANASKFDKMSKDSRRDLDALKNAYRHNDPVPRFHYENRVFTMVQCCTDLAENDIQVSVVRAIQLSNEMDTYVQFEFPFPADDSPKFTTNAVKGSNAPEYGESFKIEGNRKSRSFLRIMKSKSVKFEVFYKRGIFKSDKVLGSITLKLQPLEDKCEMHECLDLLDGRRPCGGKLEVKVRVRDPFVNKMIENTSLKWLLLDKFERTVAPSHPAALIFSSNQSVEVLKYEKQLLGEKITKYHSKLTKEQITNLNRTAKSLDRKVVEIQNQIRVGGKDGYLNYSKDISSLINVYQNEAEEHLRNDDRDKAQIALTKKKLVQREVTAIKSLINPKSQACTI